MDFHVAQISRLLTNRSGITAPYTVFLAQDDSKFLSEFPWPISFKLLTEYKNVTQNVLLLVEQILQNAK
jgi:hypothetical protein